MDILKKQINLLHCLFLLDSISAGFLSAILFSVITHGELTDVYPITYNIATAICISIALSSLYIIGAPFCDSIAGQIGRKKILLLCYIAKLISLFIFLISTQYKCSVLFLIASSLNGLANCTFTIIMAAFMDYFRYKLLAKNLARLIGMFFIYLIICQFTLCYMIFRSDIFFLIEVYIIICIILTLFNLFLMTYLTESVKEISHEIDFTLVFSQFYQIIFTPKLIKLLLALNIVQFSWILCYQGLLNYCFNSKHINFTTTNNIIFNQNLIACIATILIYPMILKALKLRSIICWSLSGALVAQILLIISSNTWLISLSVAIFNLCMCFILPSFWLFIFQSSIKTNGVLASFLNLSWILTWVLSFFMSNFLNAYANYYSIYLSTILIAICWAINI